MSEIKVNKISPRTACGTITVGDSGDVVAISAGVPVTVNGDLKSNALKAIDGGSIISQCGSTVTIGASGDTINLASGASQSGFGRTGTVDWNTTAVTSSPLTAVSGVGYFINTTAGSITVNLPAGTAGDIVAISDYANTAATNNIVISSNGSQNIQGANSNYLINVNGGTVTLVYVDSTQGWRPTDAATASSIIEEALFVTATGGTITTVDTDYKVHTFTGPGDFTVSSAGNPIGSSTVDYLVIAGGGGGGRFNCAGGAGAGGFRESSGVASGCYTTSPLGSGVSALPVTATAYPITVGAGGSGAVSPNTDGSNSIFNSITSAGGGKGGGAYVPGNGGSGGGGSPDNPTGGSGNTPPVSPPQGNNGAPNSGPNRGGGGGGAIAAGCSVTGGNGATTSINSSPVTRGGGGGGGGYLGQPGGAGGSGGGGLGGNVNSPSADGTTNTGSGGGGQAGSSGTPTNAGNGGSGIVIIRYKFQ